MSWPSSDFELEVEQELQALRKVAHAAREVMILEWGDVAKGCAVEGNLWRSLADALEAVPKEPST